MRPGRPHSQRCAPKVILAAPVFASRQGRQPLDRKIELAALPPLPAQLERWGIWCCAATGISMILSMCCICGTSTVFRSFWFIGSCLCDITGASAASLMNSRTRFFSTIFVASAYATRPSPTGFTPIIRSATMMVGLQHDDTLFQCLDALSHAGRGWVTECAQAYDYCQGQLYWRQQVQGQWREGVDCVQNVHHIYIYTYTYKYNYIYKNEHKNKNKNTNNHNDKIKKKTQTQTKTKAKTTTKTKTKTYIFTCTCT